MRSLSIGVSVVTTIALLAGCGAEHAAERVVGSVMPPPGADASDKMAAADASMDRSGIEIVSVEGGGGAAQAAAVPPDVPRKIVYTADVSLSVEDFDHAAEQIVALVERCGGYIAESDLQGDPGRNRRGSWTARVPVERFSSFVAEVVALGELRRRQTDSQDVTEEWYDLEARAKNKKVEEERLVTHLKETTGELKDILDVERELSRVREEIERLEGRLRLLANLTSLTTVTIQVEERREYEPARAPTFAQRVGRRFEGSADQLVKFGEDLVLAVVSIVPWLPIWLVLGLTAWLLLRLLRRRRRAAVGGSDA